jgi:hypothetical protein
MNNNYPIPGANSTLADSMLNNSTGAAGNATAAAVNGTLFRGVIQKVADIHPIAAKAVSYIPEMNKQNLIFLLLLLLCWEGNLKPEKVGIKLNI